MLSRDKRARSPQRANAETQPDDAETKLEDADWPRRFQAANRLIYKRILDDKPVRAIKMF